MTQATWHTGDVLEVVETLKADSVDLVLTSPPFLALRSYLPADHPDKHLEGGSQATPGEFIDWLVDVVEALDRVLAPHGSMCIELGDTYAGSGGAGGDYGDDGLRGGQPKFRQTFDGEIDGKRLTWPLAKSLTLIPELFRMTLVYGTNPLTGRQTEPWRLRNVIRWVRPNPPVGALGDKFRPATSELMVFCKSAKRYFDLDAVREPFSDNSATPHMDDGEGGYFDSEKHRGAQEAGARAGRGNASRWTGRSVNTQAGAPPLDWWQIPTHPYKGAHYATWPPALCVKPIKAMCPERVCLVCGEPSRRIVETGTDLEAQPGARLDNWDVGKNCDQSADGKAASMSQGGFIPNHAYSRKTVGWSDCGHSRFAKPSDSASRGTNPKTEQPDIPNWRPGHVLDPFAGTGTVLAVATGHGRDATGIDLDPRNADLARERVGPLFFNEAATVP